MRPSHQPDISVSGNDATSPSPTDRCQGHSTTSGQPVYSVQGATRAVANLIDSAVELAAWMDTISAKLPTEMNRTTGKDETGGQ